LQTSNIWKTTPLLAILTAKQSRCSAVVTRGAMINNPKWL